MENFRPTYNLVAIKAAIGSPDTLAMTASAYRSALTLGFDRFDVVKVINSIVHGMFYKSMTTFADHRVWQDVYHVPVEDFVLYINFKPMQSQNSNWYPSRRDSVSSKTSLPLTMVAPETGATLKRTTRPFVVTYKGESVTVDLPGYYPEGEGDGVLVGDDMYPADEALRLLKHKLDRMPLNEGLQTFAAEIQRVSKKAMDQTTEHMERLRTAGSFEEIIAIQTAFLKQSFDSYTEYTRRFSELMVALPMSLARQSHTGLQLSRSGSLEARDQLIDGIRDTRAWTARG